MEHSIYGMSNNGLIQAIADHSDIIKLNCNIEDEQPIVIVDDLLLRPPEGSKVINTSQFAKLLAMDEQALADFNEAFGITKKKASSVYYCCIKDGGVSPACEIGFSMRYMNGNVGAELFFSHACGFMIDDKETPEQISNIITYLQPRYTGELALALDEAGNVCRVVFGHLPHLMSIYAEFFTGDIDQLLGWMSTDDIELPIFKRGTSLMVAVSKYPYPFMDASQAYVRAEIEAEKHLWRMPCGLVFVSAWSDAEQDKSGTSFTQCRKRIFRTIKRMRKYDDFLHYRTDIGYSLKYSIATEEYQALQR